jgi:hypothetical protein
MCVENGSTSSRVTSWPFSSAPAALDLSPRTPEYLGVWEWADLEIDECCPFCGCLCGMHFQEASQMYYCIRCDTLTDFSELDPREYPPDE